MKTVLLKQLEFLISYQTGFISSWERMVIFCSPPCGLTCLDFRRHRNIPSSRIERSNGRVLFRKALHLHVFRDLWQWHPTPILLPGKSHGWRSLVGCSPWGHEESDTTEWLHFHFSLSCIGEGNGSPLQYSCLENPRDGSLVVCRLWGHTESDTTEAT